MSKQEDKYTPDFVFEASWEVCNKVGGIYTVLSTKAKTMLKTYNENVLFIGPDVWQKSDNPWFIEDDKLFADWKNHAAQNDDLKVRIGKWDIPGQPTVALVDFRQFFALKNDIYTDMWNKFKVDSLHAYGDYDESCMFAYATGIVIESFYKYHKLNTKSVIAHFNEWMLGMGELYVKDKLPKVATVFTTHATTIGRSIAGNNKPLYNYLYSYNGDQMAQELNVASKHSIEKRAAQEADCFTTVSRITAKECKQLLECEPVVTPNGFETDFVPKGKDYEKKQREAKKTLLNVAEKLTGSKIKKDALLVATCGRYEYKNKGLDVFIDSLAKLNHNDKLERDIIAFIMIPAWVKEPRVDLRERINSKETPDTPLSQPYMTHWLNNMEHDPIIHQINFLGLDNRKTNKVKIIFAPSYLNGDDGIFNKSYYDLLIGVDITVFPSYYEPWGYTPHESIAFSIPTVTTSLAGFGIWAKKDDARGISDGVEVIRRDDYNFTEVSSEISNMLFDMTTKNNEQVKQIRKAAADRAAQADWKHFFIYYQEAYNKALETAQKRNRI